MSTPIISQPNNRLGLCPHELPPNACPICSASSGMSANRVKTFDSPKKSSTEWSWLKCYAAGLAIKAQQNRQENIKSSFDRQIEFAKKLSESIQNLSDRIKTSFLNFQNSLPKNIQPIFNFISNIIINPLLNMIAQLPKLLEKSAFLTNNIFQFIQQASEKLTSILGDIKNFFDKKIFEDLKKRLKKFFFLNIDIEDENYKNDDNLQVFKSREMKKLFYQIIKIIGKDKENEHNTNKIK